MKPKEKTTNVKNIEDDEAREIVEQEIAAAFVISRNVGNVIAVLRQTDSLHARLTFVDSCDRDKRVPIPHDTALTEYLTQHRVAPYRHGYDVCLDRRFLLRVGGEVIQLPTIAFSDFY